MALYEWKDGQIGNACVQGGTLHLFTLPGIGYTCYSRLCRASVLCRIGRALYSASA